MRSIAVKRFISGGTAAGVACGLSSLLSGCGASDSGPTMGLMPLRMLYAPSVATSLFDDDAALVEDALRIGYAIVECRGPDAVSTFATLRKLAGADGDGISRKGNRIYVHRQDAPGLVTNCAVRGTDLLSIGSFTKIFSRAPRTQLEFELQQLVWVSIRDAGSGTQVGYPEAFQRFLAENLGAEPVSTAAMKTAIAKLEALYNPCVADSSAFDKASAFHCDAAQGPIPSGDLTPLAQSLDRANRALNDTFLAGVEQQPGLRAAAKVNANIASLPISGVMLSGHTQVTYANPLDQPPSFASGALSKVRMAIDARRKTLEDVFGLVFGDDLTPVLSLRSPRPLPLPPTLADGTLARPGEADVSTMKAIPLSDGSYAAPNPTIRTDTTVAPRWERWTYAPGGTWTLVGHKGMPAFAPPSTPGVLATLVRPTAATTTSPTRTMSLKDGLGQSAAAEDQVAPVGTASSTGAFMDAYWQQKRLLDGNLRSVDQDLNNTAFDPGKNQRRANALLSDLNNQGGDFQAWNVPLAPKGAGGTDADGNPIASDAMTLTRIVQPDGYVTLANSWTGESLGPLSPDAEATYAPAWQAEQYARTTGRPAPNGLDELFSTQRYSTDLEPTAPAITNPTPGAPPAQGPGFNAGFPDVMDGSDDGFAPPALSPNFAEPETPPVT